MLYNIKERMVILIWEESILEKEKMYMNTFLKERKLITKEQEFKNQDLRLKLKLMNMAIEPMKNIIMEDQRKNHKCLMEII